MRLVLCLAGALLFSAPTFAEQLPSCDAAVANCAPTPPSKQDLKKARKEFEKAQKLQHNGKYEQAIAVLDEAIALSQGDNQYVAMREMLRQQLVTVHIKRGNELLAAKKSLEAMVEFRQALEIDPKNEFAIQRLEDSLPPRPVSNAAGLSPTLTMVAQSQPVLLLPSSEQQEFHFRGFSKTLLEQVAAKYGVKAAFDESVTSKPIRFDLDPVDFFTAIREASKQAHVFWFALGPKTIFFANDTQALRRQLEKMVTRTFYLSEATAPQDVNDVVNLLRTIFDIRFVAAQPGQNSLVVRAPADTLEAAAKVLDTFLSRKPQVMLDVQVFEVSNNLTRQVGISLPNNFQVINVGAAALAALGQTNNSDLINQLISSGGINAANSQGIQALLAQLQSQQNSVISTLLQTPFATFGAGKGLTAVTLPGTTVNFQLNESDFQSLSKLSLRTSQGNAATMRLGSRFPILNASFAPVFNTPAIASVLQNGSYAAPFPSFTYEDLGITLKATPQVLGDNSVTLKLEMQIKALTGQSFNGVPVISNREYSASMSVQDGEQAAVIGMITQSEMKNLSGIPGLSQIPLLRHLTTNTSKNVTADELLITVTPYIMSPTRRMDEGKEVWMKSGQ